MKLEHLAIWVKDLEVMKQFYLDFFDGTASEKYNNIKTGFESYFISFSSGTRLEIMKKPNLIPMDSEYRYTYYGYAHLAFSTGSKEEVDSLTEELESKGYKVISRPRTTGDGYYESAILDPEGNIVEITI